MEITVKDALTELGKNKKKYEDFYKRGVSLRFVQEDPKETAAYGLFLASKTSPNPNRFLETLSPFYDSKLSFDLSKQKGREAGVVEGLSTTANIFNPEAGIVAHELVHTLQNKETVRANKEGIDRSSFEKEQRAGLFERAKELNKNKQIVFPAANWNAFQDELLANIIDMSRAVEEEGKDFTKTPAFNLLFPDEKAKQFYYTKTLPETTVVYPASSTFQAAPERDKNQSYARQLYNFITDLRFNKDNF